ncbi:MAG: ribosome biogenesis GTPase YlqF [Hydrogenophaga sp.]|nr:ribosome biogenesis GTPase YlqF [Hydrogenophaga sp.]
MSVQWFPGHMHLTRQAIATRVKTIDVVIEMLDARLPGSSANPLLGELTQKRATLKVLNKQDLADPERTAQWLAHYNAQPGTRAIGLDASVTAPARALVAACRELAPSRGGMAKPLRVLICGVPNVGKSTLINTLMGKRSTKTGDEAGVTRNEQRVALADDVYLYDTPGVLWPRIIVPQSGIHLAASGAVGRNAYDDQEVAYELLDNLKLSYPALLRARYPLGDADAALADMKAEDMLDAIGRQRGALVSGGRVDAQKTAELVIADFRTALMGRITLETPEQYKVWLKAGQAADAERQRLKRERFGDERPRPRPRRRT